ncbi:glycosyltransferase [Allosaccharopolyspora coralli]|uniref:Glycosyltransferase n=1 Tax=Allosaccharopolyspora coralli TaxID=2665642 RepID=A0A5Q3QBX0_9PSEU|nr:glycosyltransferase family 2 protein [Allosaccharopolyspora coralli]QGK71370.1 glycosyltransferase [Allosaccharopolyspora coralli]
MPAAWQSVGVVPSLAATRNLLLGAVASASVVRGLLTVRRARTAVPLSRFTPESRLPARVSVVIPARNEEAVLDECLRGARDQNYGRTAPSAVRIVVVDDGSTDGTSRIAERHAAQDSRVQIVRVDGPPPGWTGKVHAMHVGVQAVGEPEAGEWLLFVDADTVLGPELLGRLLDTADSVDADLVSTPGGPPTSHSSAWPLLMPPGLQMIAENASPDGRGRKAFAIGHCILMRRSHYEKVGGWEALAERRNEDVAIATSVRDHGGTVRTVDGLDHVTTSGMDPFRQGWGSFRKSFVAGTRASVPVLIGGGLGQIALSLAAPAAVVVGLRRRRGLLAAAGIAGWVAQGAAHERTARFMRAEPSLAPLAPLTNALFGGVLLDGAIRVVRGQTAWKGRRTRT